MLLTNSCINIMKKFLIIAIDIVMTQNMQRIWHRRRSCIFFAKLSDYHYKGKTKNYLYTIAGNLCKDYYKKKKEVLAEDEVLERNILPGADQEEGVVTKVVVKEALEKLSEEYREVIILYYFQDLKLSEIADVLQINLSLVKYRMRQAKKQLEQYLGREGFYESGK